jgi:hypothetical protein
MIKKIATILLPCILFLNSEMVFANEYLTKPTGEYNVSFKDVELYKTESKYDEYYEHRNIIIRIYYPTSTESARANYDFTTLETQAKKRLALPYSIVELYLSGFYLSNIKSFASEDSQIVPNKTFPVLLFIPGYGAMAQFYENFITELVSHGYIVIGINSEGSNPIVLANDIRLEKKCSSENILECTEQAMPQLIENFAYVINKAKEFKDTNKSIFSAMDLDNIGIFGHSLGANAVLEFARQLSNDDSLKIHAIASLDHGLYTPEETLETIKIASIHIFRDSHHLLKDAKKQLENTSLSECVKNYMETCKSQNHDRSYQCQSPKNNKTNFVIVTNAHHTDFTDLATLQNMILVKGAKLIANIPYSTDSNDNVKFVNVVNRHLLNFFNSNIYKN